MNLTASNNNSIVHLSHHDLDCLGCMLHLNFATAGAKTKTFHTNYFDIEEKVSDVCEYCQMNVPKLLLITDVSFSGNKGQLLKLQEMQNLGIIVILLDHHEYPEGFFDDLTMKYVHDITKSATKITQEFFKTKGANSNLDLISEYINAYDIWVSKSNYFQTGIIINDFFWTELDGHHNIDTLTDEIISIGYKLPPRFKDFFNNYKIQSSRKISNFKDRKLLMSDGYFTVAFVDELFNQIIYEEFAKGTQFIMIANSYGITRFRFNGDTYLSREIREEIKMKLIGTLENGHLNAFSDKIFNSNFNKIMNRVQEVQGILNEYKKV